MRYLHHFDDRKGLATIISLLHRDGEKIYTHLKNAVRLSNQSVYFSVEKLLNLGLIEQEYTKVPYSRVFRLTEKGKRVAVLLVKIDSIMSD